MSHHTLPSRAPLLGAALVAAAWAPEARALRLFGSTCSEPIGTVRISEPDDGEELWASYGLSAPTRMLRVMVNESGCFTVVDRGAGLAAIRDEQELASAGQLREGHSVGGGQIRAADFVLIPDLVSQNANAGGSSFGAGAEKRGLFSGIGGSVGMSKHSQKAEVVLTLVDARTSEQVVTVSGEAKITDKAREAALRAHQAGVRGGIHYSSWENTEIGQVIKKAYEEAFEKMEPALRKLAAQRSGRPTGMMGAAMSLLGMPGSQGKDPQQTMQVMQQVAQQAGFMPAQAPAQAEPQAVAPAAVPMAVAAAPAPAPAPAAAPARDVAGLVQAQTLQVRRAARLLAQPSAGAEAVGELRPGMLLFPTGTHEGALIEVEDEVGNRGWVPAAAVEAAS